MTAALGPVRHLTEDEAVRLGTDIQRRIGVKTSRQEPLARFTTMRVGGPADLFAEIHNLFELRAIVRFARQRELSLFVLGRGSNLVIADQGIPGLVVLNRAQGHRIEEHRLIADSGLAMARAATITREAGLAGLEFGLAIPGTVGGAVWANAGAHESEVAAVLASASVLRADGTEAVMAAGELDLGYRESVLKHATEGTPEVVTSATFALSPAEPDEIGQRLDVIRRWRQANQPLGMPSAGSVFRNPEGDSAGRIVDELGLKGRRVGGASVSPKHANFIVNDQAGTAADVRRLAEDLRSIVARERGIELVFEVAFVGDWSGWGGPGVTPRRIAVLLGGPSAEHDVSLVSGRQIAGALAERGHQVEGWLIDLDRSWWQLPASALDAGLPPTAFDDPSTLGADGPLTSAAALERLAGSTQPPVVFPALHGPFGEDGTVQALLASADLVTCGSDVGASAIGMSKPLFKRLCGAMELPVLPWVEVRADAWARDQRSVVEELESFARELPDPRLVVKPASLGSSIGITIVHRPDEPPELEHAVADALRHDELVLAEPYLDHPRELEAAVLGNARDDLEVFGPGEIVPGREFYDYVAKYRDGGSRTTTTPDLDELIRDDVRRISGEVFLAIGAAGFARVDFLLGQDDFLVVSEINTIPGFTPISLFPMLCAEGGYGFGEVCERIVELAIERAAHRPIRRLTRAELP